MTKPIIGVTVDAESGGENQFSERPWFAVRENYCEAVAKGGGIPILLPHFNEYVGDYIKQCAGFVIVGGAAHVPPELYGETPRDGTKTKPKRTAFEKLLIEAALKQNKPVLGICGGMQLMNVILGGSLIQHLPDEIKGDIDHMQKTGAEQAHHPVRIVEGTLLHKIAGSTNTDVNSSHYQSVRKISDQAVINAVAPDGVIEGIEAPAYKFCLGVQWHPEYDAAHIDNKIMRALCDASKS